MDFLRVQSGGLIRNDRDAVFTQQCRGDTRLRIQTAGGTAGFQQAAGDLLHLGDGKHHAGTFEKGLRTVDPVAVDDAGVTCKDVVAVAADDFGCGSWGGHAAELFGADRNPMEIGKMAQAFGIPFAFAVVTGAEADEAGADQTVWFSAVHDGIGIS